ncbi:SDR family NAD(P)-dependent oxidoreductase [Sodalis sp. RH21]|uniref:SDR family NAD(P)-dependent oxidoreductase n=1 Tax=unclassified Sodalis (in: enterobacteria) TaxID=2636512 RepID=UPI0039B6DD2B
MKNTLTDKVALITGGSRGIGAAIVRRLAAEGAKVAFTYAASAGKAHELAAEIESQGGAALAIAADSGEVRAVQDAVTLTVAQFGRLDILVNNAGIMIQGAVDDYAISDFNRMLDVNVRATFVAVQAAIPHMGPGGRIITTGSVTAERTAFPGSSVYSMTKGAIAALTRGLAWDLGKKGITINVIQPGPTETDMNQGEDIRARLRAMMALGRMGKDAEIAGLVAYLASPEAAFITGSALTVDGGYLA